jgi:hypothetical protein
MSNGVLAADAQTSAPDVPRSRIATLHLRTALAAAVHVGLVVTLLLLPFENLFTRIFVAGRRLTDLELVALATTVVWVALLVVERRRPAVPRSVHVAVLVLVGVWVVSTTVAAEGNPSVYWFVLRSSIAASLLLVAADQVRRPVTATRLLGWLLATMALSAGLGVASWIAGNATGLPGAGRLFDVGGIARTAGTFVHPNEAAMAWVATLVASVPLVMTSRSRVSRIAVAAVIALLAVALVLTVSRGGLLGLGAGLAVLAVGGLYVGTRAISAVAVTIGVVVIGASVVFQLGSGLPVSRLVTEGDRGLYGASYEAPRVIQAAPGSRIPVSVGLINTGEGTWTTGDAGYALSYHWLDLEGREDRSRSATTTPLTVPVEPGEQSIVEAMVVAPPDPGRYRIAWDLRQDGTTWFSEKSVLTAVTSVVLTPGADPQSAGSAPSYELYPELFPVPTRPELWEAALRMVRSEPLLGIGPGQFRLQYGGYLGWPRWNGGIHANNLYLELLANTGLIGFAAFLAVLGLALAPQLRRLAAARGAGPAALLNLSLIAAITAFLAHQLVDYFFGFTPTAMLFWVLLGIGLGLALTAGRAGPLRAGSEQPTGQS